MYLVAAIALSMILHFMILYVPFFTTLFSITPLDSAEWLVVVAFSLPVVFLDEGLKWVSRNYIGAVRVEKEKKID